MTEEGIRVIGDKERIMTQELIKVKRKMRDFRNVPEERGEEG